MNKYKIFSNAKINIGLNVFQKEDDGYHNIDSIMAPIDLSDEMDITFYSELGDLKIECSDKNIPTDKKNILFKTYKIFFEESKKEKRKIDIILKKDNKTLTIPYENDKTDRDITIKTLNDFIAPKYQIRLFSESLGDDTLAFTVLNSDEWKDLENEFGKEKLEFFFTPVSQLNGLFNMSMDEAMKIYTEREVLRDKIFKNN